LSDLLELSEEELNDLLNADQENAIIALQRVLGWLSSAPDLASRIALNEVQLPTLSGLVSQTHLQTILKLWRDNAQNPDEEFWQSQLTDHSFALGLLFAYPIVIIKGKAYVGGKEYDNRHGNLVDFLGRIPASRSAVLIEIKNPSSALLGPQYRNDIYPPSPELVGAISQVLHYRESLMGDRNVQESADLSAAGPRCVVIVGSASNELVDDSHKRSFERFRERLLGVTIVTFDEMLSRVQSLVELFS